MPQKAIEASARVGSALVEDLSGVDADVLKEKAGWLSQNRTLCQLARSTPISNLGTC
jgi:hypothetical protein